MSFHSLFLLVLLLVALVCPHLCHAGTYPINSVLGSRFDGVGGLSGGGATSRLLPDYIEPYRSQILDYLFLPNFGASLHILKVEIGGDAQSTEGTEASHMHEAGMENYQRGYEWWLMKQAKQRNPNIKLYGLAWGFPHWVGEGGNNPLTNTTVTYIVKWLIAAQQVHGLTIDYVGVWNERSYSRAYVVSLKAAMIQAGLKTQLVVGDGGWGICDDLNKDPEWTKSVDIVGAHYPNTGTSGGCTTLHQTTGMPLWASEDDSSYYTNGPCWARLINRNYPLADITGIICWNLIAAYYDELPYSGDGLMHGHTSCSSTPWTGHYDVDQVIWATAHFTQFSQPGWTYLKVGSGAGVLNGQGVYAGMTDGNGALTITVEAMTSQDSACIRERSSANVSAEQVTFQLQGSFASITGLHVFSSQLGPGSNNNQWFIYQGFQPVRNNQISINLQLNMIYTLSTLNGTKGNYSATPAPSAFPFPYSDNFDSYVLSSEAYGFTDQSGSFEIVAANDTSRGNVMRQMMPVGPISWCSDPKPYSVIGSHAWGELRATVDVLIETNTGTAFVAAAVNSGGCVSGTDGSTAIVFAVTTANGGEFQLSRNTGLTDIIESSAVKILPNTWYTLALDVAANQTTLFLNGNSLYTTSRVTGRSHGWVAIGSGWNYAQFDAFSVAQSSQERQRTTTTKVKIVE